MDGSDLKEKLEDYFVVVRNSEGEVVGCTTSRLTPSSPAPPPPGDDGELPSPLSPLNSFSVVLITAGDNQDFHLNTVEVFVPSTGFSCELELPLPYLYLHGHLQAGGVLCGGESGGGGSLTRCVSWQETGDWSSTHQLDHQAMLGSVWRSSRGPVILAASQTYRGAVRLEEDGSVTSDYFQLEHSREFSEIITEGRHLTGIITARPALSLIVRLTRSSSLEDTTSGGWRTLVTSSGSDIRDLWRIFHRLTSGDMAMAAPLTGRAGTR